MSLSQKHSGKILVPWFNKSEWKSVYDLISLGTDDSFSRALLILRIWKLRTPLLSAGVEGTLIVLETLLMDLSNRSDFEVSNIYSTSLVRFLNLCATNSDKQGTFHKTAKKYNLPSWLISLRHDIAHSNKLPSKSMLEISLKYCLTWIKRKYWEVEFVSTSDVVIDDVPNNQDTLQELVHLSTLLNSEDVSEHQEEVDKLIGRVFENSRKKDPELIQKKISKLMKTTIRNDIRNSMHEINKIIQSGTLFDTNYEKKSDGKKAIPHAFIKKWNIFLNAVNDSRILLDFVNSLLNFVCESSREDNSRLIASLWIRDIFLGLAKASDDNAITFNKSFPIKDKKFATEALNNPNEFTTNFLKEVLEYNEAPTKLIEDAVHLLNSLIARNNVKVNGILTSNSLNFNMKNIEEKSNKVNLVKQSDITDKGWTMIEDITAYKNLPLGILPHQSRHINPIL